MKPEPLTDEQLVAALRHEADAAQTFQDSDLSARQDECQRYYDAEPFGDEVDGLSQIVLPDVEEAVDHMTISVLRTFVSGDRVVEFQAKQDGEEQAVDQATEAVHQIFMQQQDGYRVLHDWLKSGLIEIIGVVKSTVIEEDLVQQQRFTATSEEELAAAEAQGLFEGAEVETAIREDGGFDVTVKRAQTRRNFRDITLPSHEYRFQGGARNEDDADYQAHVCRKTRSELVEMGFDLDLVYSLSTGDDDAALEADEALYALRSDVAHASLQEVTLHEEYIRIDRDGDGIAERLKCFRVGDKLLEEPEVVDDHPFTVFCPFPRPHQMAGKSLAEKAMPVQRLRSVTARQLMNGMYLANQPRMWLDESTCTENTINDLLTVIPGAPVRGKGAAPQPLNQGFDVGKSLTVMEFWSGEKESRTGITRMNQGLDADALNKTATGTALMQAQGQQYEEFIARNFAECVARMFWRKYRLIKDVGEPFTVKIGGSFTEVDPTNWPDEPDMVIRTGLGTNRKEYRIGQRMQLLEMQKEALGLGLATPQHLFNGAAGLVRDMGIGQPDDYFLDPSSDQAQQMQAQQGEQIDPETAKAQADQQVQMAKIQSAQELAAAKMESQREEAALKQELAREEAEFEAQLAERKFEFERQMAEDRAAFERQMVMQRAATAQDHALPRNRPGGRLDA